MCVWSQHDHRSAPPPEGQADIAALISESAPSTKETNTQSLSLPNTEAIDDPQWGKSPPTSGEITVLHGLDKMTARVFALEVKHNQPIRFGTLRITVRGCKRTPPEDPPESAAFLEVIEEKKDETPQLIFSGWMFASLPSVSALEHPVYDVWVTECIPSKKAHTSTP